MTFVAAFHSAILIHIGHKPPYIHVGKTAKVTCMEMTIPSADHDVLFTRGISASTECNLAGWEWQ